MKRLIGVSTVLLALCGGSLLGASIDWGVDFSGATFSNGITIPTGFTFELGTFITDFAPDADNTGQWAENFLTGGIDANSITWTNENNSLFPTFGEAGGTSMFRPDGTVVEGDQAFIWGYNSREHVVTSEWILLTNPVWLFPEGTPVGEMAAVEVDFFATNVGTVALLSGAFNLAGNEDFLTREWETQAIPEPSTYTLIFATGIFAFLGWRRIFVVGTARRWRPLVSMRGARNKRSGNPGK